MKKSSVPFEQVQSDLLNSLEKPVQFFEKIKQTYNKKELAEIYGYIVETCTDMLFLGNTLKEIDKLRDVRNLNCLIDFLLIKTKENFNVSNSQISDFINLRVLCVKVISNFKNTQAVPALLYCLNSKGEHYKFRLAVAEALGKIGDKNAVDSLIEVVSDEEEKSVYVRESAAKALGMIGDLRAIEAFLGILEAKKTFLDKFTFLKERVIEAMGKMELSTEFSENKRMLNALTNALSDDSPQIRLSAIESLSNSNFPEAENLIKKMVFDTDIDVAIGATTALYNILDKEGILELLEDKNLPEHVITCAQELLEDEEQEEDESEC